MFSIWPSLPVSGRASFEQSLILVTQQKMISKYKFHLLALLIGITLVTALAFQAKASLVGTTSQAVLSFSPQTGNYNVGDTFNVTLNLNTGNKSVVAVAAEINFDAANFDVTAIANSGSPFSIQAEQTYDNTTGVIKIARAAPGSGVNSTQALVAVITFKVVGNTAPANDNLTVKFTSGSTADYSGVIAADNMSADILSGAFNARYTVRRTYGIADFTLLVTNWLKTVSSPADVNGDGTVNSRDLGIMMSNWSS
jgi:hypothetical protein